ncbi:hypothetical protein C8F04DRAFT_1173103 [Mycena alexandri]|uniref:Uncharacterized protein n=1 Tax=Mycena alexandri TaxID=1745969 RepID=A0AAD6TI62_9AGAR|nr:hypothetical protein C8F04DRAFT_1173103 [Mycena alexandri]
MFDRLWWSECSANFGTQNGGLNRLFTETETVEALQLFVAEREETGSFPTALLSQRSNGLSQQTGKAENVNGSAVVARIIRDGTFTSRAITRDPQSAASLELEARGIEVVKGESGDKASLVSLQKTFGRHELGESVLALLKSYTDPAEQVSGKSYPVPEHVTMISKAWVFAAREERETRERKTREPRRRFGKRADPLKAIAQGSDDSDDRLGRVPVDWTMPELETPQLPSVVANCWPSGNNDKARQLFNFNPPRSPNFRFRVGRPFAMDLGCWTHQRVCVAPLRPSKSTKSRPGIFLRFLQLNLLRKTAASGLELQDIDDMA